MSPRTALSLFRAWRSRFIDAGVPEPHDSALHIVLSSICVQNRQYMRLGGEMQEIKVDHTQIKLINQRGHRRLQREPVQYIVGHWDFRDINLDMKAPVLIPRPETEELVGHVLDDMKTIPGPLRILEIGCGSGPISLSLLHHNRQVHVTAIDIDKNAVDLTRTNAIRLGLQSRLCLEHKSVQKFSPSQPHQFDFVIANPPYIPSREVDTLAEEVSRYESRLALDGGEDGLYVVRAILSKAALWLIPRPSSAVWLEVDRTHERLFQQHSQQILAGTGLRLPVFRKDFNGIPRFCRLGLL